ncbi:phytoene/squalene synthase family protein [Phenylobacterium sp.]|jgi:phytoene synthase|uniref:phytoene/squalene synthase family protein n=1 Tax=Phenylobacterium sp. TaxID=1871053 RepID=UPI002F93A48E
MDAVVAHSEAAMEKGSSSFRAATRLFGEELREDVWQLYAWCRRCDDEIDGQDHGGVSAEMSAAERRERLEWIRRRTHAAMAGEPVKDPAFVAFQRVAAKHRLDEAWPQELLDGFALDVDEAKYATVEDLLAYCWGVAGVVGVMMAQIMGVRDAEVLKRAQDLGLAFQLTNICRDVREDALNGRVYLPAERLSAAGVPATAEALRNPFNHDQIFRVVAEQLALAERYYASARVGLRDLPFRGALAVAAARDVYRAIGRRILSRGPDALASRMSVPKPLMALLVARGVLVALWSRADRLFPRPARPALWSKL